MTSFRGMFLMHLLLLYITTVSSFSSHMTKYLPFGPMEHRKVDESPIYRLPDNAIPTQYVLKITPDLEASKFDGTVDISIQIVRTTNKIELFSKGLKVTKCEIEANEKFASCTYRLDQNKDLLIITSPVQLRKSRKYTISLRYWGKLNEEMVGLYKSSYEENGVKKWLVVTNFEPTYARQAFPCFDEPQFKTPFSISICRKENQRSISNMPRRMMIDDKDRFNMKWDIFHKTPPIPTYSVGFMVTEMFGIRGTSGVTTWTRHDIKPYIYYAINQGDKLFKFFEEFTNLPYQPPELNIVVLPNLKTDAVQSWGIIIFKELNIILDEASSSLSQKVKLTRILSHKLSSLWFGNLQTPTKWEYFWLRDGYAKYFEYFATAQVEPRWNLDDLFILEVLQPALRKEETHGRALTTPVILSSHLETVYDVITHNKAASILRMIEQIITPKSFKKAVQNFLIRSRSEPNNDIIPDHFFEALEVQVKADSIALPSQTTITEVMKSWTENVGYPMIRMYHNISPTKNYFYQTPFISKKLVPRPKSQQNWILPLTCIKESSFNVCAKSVSWLHDDSMVESPLGNRREWILCNLEHKGYYRIRNSFINVDHIIRTLRTNPQLLPPLIKAQLIDDAFAISANIEDQIYGIPFKLTHLLKNDINIMPWITATFHLQTLWVQYRNFRSAELFLFMQDILQTKILDHIGFNTKETDDPLTRKARTEILYLACRLGLKGCVEPAINEYKKNFVDISRVHPDLKEVVYCAVLRHSNDQTAIWNNLWSLYDKTKFPYDRATILKTFPCAENETLIQWTLARMVNRIPIQDHEYIINGLSYSSYGVDGAVKFLKDNIITSHEHGHDVNPSWKSILIFLETGITAGKQHIILEETEIYLKNTNKSDYVDLYKLIFQTRRRSVQHIRENYENSFTLMKTVGDIIEDPFTFTPYWMKTRSSGIVSTPTFVYVFCSSLALYYNKIF